MLKESDSETKRKEKVALIEWNEKYSVGIAEIDEQHKQLIGYVNNLYDYMKQGKSKEILEPLFKDLYKYTQTHFLFEEKLMLQNNYPDYHTHKSEHSKFIQKLDDLKEKFNKNSFSAGIETMTMLKGWLNEHIYHQNSHDKQLYKIAKF